MDARRRRVETGCFTAATRAENYLNVTDNDKPYRSARSGALFFATFFWASKRK